MNEARQELVNPLEIYKRLKDILINETNCDELLHFQSAIINYMIVQTNHLDKTIKQSKNLDSFAVESHQMEIQRIKYLIHRYFAIRIEKIEKNSSYLIRLIRDDHENACELMSVEEISYLKNYVSTLDCYLNDVVLKNMPANMQSFNICDIQQDPKNDHCEYNFVKANVDTSVIVEDPQIGSQIIELKKDGQYFLPIGSLKPHLLSNQDLVLL